MSQRRTERRSTVATRRRNRKHAMLLVLLAVMAVIWGRNFLLEAIRSATAAESTPDTGSSAADTERRRAGTPVAIDWPPDAGRDPFSLDRTAYQARPPEVDPDLEPVEIDPEAGPTEREQVEAAINGLVLQATMLGETPRAIINGRSYRLGEVVNGLRITAIEARRVRMDRDGIKVDLLIESSGSNHGEPDLEPPA